MIDLNSNGIPDERDPAMARFVWKIAVALVRLFAPPHTVIRRATETADGFVATKDAQVKEAQNA